MIVVAHGAVDDYCAKHGMIIGERYDGDLEKYTGPGLILVTDNCADKNEYYYLKMVLRRRKITLISIWWDDPGMNDFLEYLEDRRRRKSGGRKRFGEHNAEELAVVRRIFELRDTGATMKEIGEDPGVRYLDGREIPVSSIQVILKNRRKYDL